MDRRKLDLSLPWFKLDNAAKIFPGQNSSTWSNIIRASVTLTEEIEPRVLERAASDCLKRFPTVAVKMRRGFFWYYFEKNEAAPVVREGSNNPCVRIKYNENNRFLFRIFYYGCTISLEIFHAVTDGYGAMVFLNTVAARYLTLKGHKISSSEMVLDINEAPSAAELEDSFIKYAHTAVKAKRASGSVYHRAGERLPKYMSFITNGYIPLDVLKQKCREKGATITEYLAAVLIMVHIKLQKSEERKQKPVSVQVPVNCRNQFDSRTLRNFTVCYSVKIDPRLGEYTFDEVLRQFSLYLRYTNNKKNLSSMFAANLGLENNPVMRLLPLVIKDLGVALSFALTAEITTTALLSNLGRNILPEDMLEHVRCCSFMPSPGKVNGGRVGAVSCGNVMTVTFANIYNNTDIEREFFTFLVKQGIHVRVESNKTMKTEELSDVLLR